MSNNSQLMLHYHNVKEPGFKKVHSCSLIGSKLAKTIYCSVVSFKILAQQVLNLLQVQDGEP